MYLIVVSAPSGAGKTTLCRMLLSDFPQVSVSVSTTSRLPRGREESGREYHFVTRQEFQEQIDRGEFIEWAIVHDEYYGTSRLTLERAMVAGQCVLLDIDVQGAAQLSQLYPQRCYRIFIAPPSIAELEFRLRARGTDPEERIQKRIQNAYHEMEQSTRFDLIVVNDEIDRAYEEIKRALIHNLQLHPRS